MVDCRVKPVKFATTGKHVKYTGIMMFSKSNLNLVSMLLSAMSELVLLITSCYGAFHKEILVTIVFQCILIKK